MSDTKEYLEAERDAFEIAEKRLTEARAQVSKRSEITDCIDSAISAVSMYLDQCYAKLARVTRAKK